jgi:thiol-disulfide isomerase/thioredoxin
MPRRHRALSPDVSGGFIALLAAIGVAIVGGAGIRLTSGRMRAPRRAVWSGMRNRRIARVPDRNGLVPGTAGPAASAVIGTPAAPAAEGLRLTGEQLGHALGERATLVQFSTAFCAPCRATRRILADVADMTRGVAHVEIDAESRLDLVRELNVLRTPTVLVLAADGSIVRRASGQPRKPDVIAAIGLAVGP